MQTKKKIEKRKADEVKSFLKTKTVYIAECSVCGDRKEITGGTGTGYTKDEATAVLRKAGWEAVTYKNQLMCPDCFKEHCTEFANKNKETNECL